MRGYRMLAAIAAGMLAGTAAGQSFQDGQLYLLSASLPYQGSWVAGAVRIDTATWSVKPVVYRDELGGRGSYDAFRDRIITKSMYGAIGLGALAADGTMTALPISGPNDAMMVAAGSDGRIYFQRANGFVSFLDAAGVTHDVFEADGITHTILATITAFWYDANKGRLFVASGNGIGARIDRIVLGPAGDRVVSRSSCAPAATTNAFPVVTSFSEGPSGTIFISIDDNSNDTAARLQVLDPDSMTCSAYANTGYFGAAGEVTGAYVLNPGFGVALDTLGDQVRVYNAGDVGEGTVHATHLVSSAGGSGELAQFVYIHKGCRADFNGDGFTDIYDFTDFVTCFEGGACPPGKSADYNGDGFPDIYDFTDFVTDFEVGC